MNRKISSKMGRGKHDQIIGLALVAPLLIWLLVTVVYPLFYTFSLSLQNQGLLGSESEFVGLANFIDLFKDTAFWNGLKNSVIWTVGNSILQGIGGLTVAMLLNQKFRGKKLLRVWVIFPWIIPTVVMAIVWKWILNSTYGVIGWIIVRLGFASTPPVFLGDMFNSLPTIIFVNSWRWVPFMAVVMLAALQTIPSEVYEAAKVDGAGAVKTFFSITLPSIQGTMSTMFLIGTLFSFNMFDVIWLMTEGGPMDVTTTLPVMIYKAAFKTFQISKAATISVVVFFILAAFVLIVTRFSSLRALEGED